MANGILPIIGMFANHEKFCGNVHKISPIGTMFAKKALIIFKALVSACIFLSFLLCYVLQLDPAAIGAPGRIGLLEELLDYIDEFDSVWWTSGEEMYQYYQNK